MALHSGIQVGALKASGIRPIMVVILVVRIGLAVIPMRRRPAHRHPLALVAVHRIDHDNRIVYHNPDQRDNADKGREREWNPGQEKAAQRAD